MRAVVEVEVVPAVAFGHPDHFVPVLHVEPVLLAGVAEERLRLFRDDGARGAECCVDLDDAVDLVAALVVLERDRAAVLPPYQRRLIVGIRKQRVFDGEDLPVLDVKHDRPFDVENVARLRVLERAVLRLELVLR